MPDAVSFPSAIRAALLDDHVRLRRGLRELEAVAAALLARECSDGELRETAMAFREALAAHNRAEEGHLGEVLRGVDAWGEIRVEQMLIEHLEEHKALLVALMSRDAPALARAIPLFARDLREHMDREERTFLDREVLRDDGAENGS